MDNKALDETLFAEVPEAIDEDGTINQYVHEERNGYLIGLENKKKIKLKMKCSVLILLTSILMMKIGEMILILME